MPHQIWKFRLPADAVVTNNVCGDESAREHILRAAMNAGIQKKNIRDRSNGEKVDIDVEFRSDDELAKFKLACVVEPTRTC